MKQVIQRYLAATEENLKAGDATEHSYLPAFKQLLDEITGLEAIHETHRLMAGIDKTISAWPLE